MNVYCGNYLKNLFLDNANTTLYKNQTFTFFKYFKYI